MAAMATSGDGLAFVGLVVLLTLKTLFSTSIRGITLSISAVDSALMLRVAQQRVLSLQTVDSHLSRGSFKGQLRQQLDNDFLS